MVLNLVDSISQYLGLFADAYYCSFYLEFLYRFKLQKNGGKKDKITKFHMESKIWFWASIQFCARYAWSSYFVIDVTLEWRTFNKG